jgi:hypothetical protein
VRECANAWELHYTEGLDNMKTYDTSPYPTESMGVLLQEHAGTAAGHDEALNIAGGSRHYPAFLPFVRSTNGDVYLAIAIYKKLTDSREYKREPLS